jgi:hypothetical protein
MMRRTAKIKSATGRMPLRKTVTSASAAARRNYPAWVDANDGPTFVGASRRATPRVRDGLVLRRVSKQKSPERSVPHGSSSR